MVTIIIETGDFKKVLFSIENGVCTPSEFATEVAKMEDLSGDKVVLINGRGPVWGYGMIVHAAHATPAVATFDPRMNGYVIVATHKQGFNIGEIITEEEPKVSESITNPKA